MFLSSKGSHSSRHAPKSDEMSEASTQSTDEESPLSSPMTNLGPLKRLNGIRRRISGDDYGDVHMESTCTDVPDAQLNGPEATERWRGELREKKRKFRRKVCTVVLSVLWLVMALGISTFVGFYVYRSMKWNAARARAAMAGRSSS